MFQKKVRKISKNNGQENFKNNEPKISKNNGQSKKTKLSRILMKITNINPLKFKTLPVTDGIYNFIH